MATFRPPEVQETAPKRPRGRPPGAASTTVTPPSRGSLKTEISGLLMTVNLGLLMIPPLKADRLDMVEIEALADALDDECRKSPKFRKAMMAALSAGSGASLFGIIAIIGARRASRHGILPPEADQELGNMLATGMQATKRARADAGLT